MAIIPPPKMWYKSKLGKDEKIWSYMIIVMILMMGIFAVTWVFAGDQNVPEEYSQFENRDFEATAIAGNSEANGVFYDTLSNGEPAFSRTTGGHIYMVAKTFEWVVSNGSVETSAIKLKAGEIYRLHIGSVDLLHGFELIGGDFIIALQIVPGYDYVFDFIPTATDGPLRIICNEYCGAGHHVMAGFMEVVS